MIGARFLQAEPSRHEHRQSGAQLLVRLGPGGGLVVGAGARRDVRLQAVAGDAGRVAVDDAAGKELEFGHDGGVAARDAG